MKKIYEAPALIIHGTVEKLTLGDGRSGASDLVFNSFTGNQFQDVGSADVCTVRNGVVGPKGCPPGTNPL